MAAWQRGKQPDAQLPTLQPLPNHTLKVPDALQFLHPVNIDPSTSEPEFNTPVDKNWFTEPAVDIDSVKKARATDMAFFLQRQDSESKPSWTVFDQSVSSEEPEYTSVGYMPLVLAPAHEFETLNTVVKRCMAIASHFGQKYTIITVDQALFCKLKKYKRKYLALVDFIYQ